MNQKNASNLPATRQDLQITEDKLQEGMGELRNDIFNRLDTIVAQLEAIREDQTLKFHQDQELKEKVDDHENRIVDLEEHKN